MYIFHHSVFKTCEDFIQQKKPFFFPTQRRRKKKQTNFYQLSLQKLTSLSIKHSIGHGQMVWMNQDIKVPFLLIKPQRDSKMNAYSLDIQSQEKKM